MALTRRARLVVGATTALTRAGLMPGAERIARQSLRRRSTMRPPKLLVGPVPTGVTTEDLTVPGRTGAAIPVRVYRPAGQDGATAGILYLHGGGWITGGMASCDHICRHLAADAGAVVVSVEYSLAPQHPFPTALHDCLDALAWFVDRSHSWAVDPNRLAVAGDSAGGNLAAAVALATRTGSTARPWKQLLIYPSLDHTCSTPSSRDYRGPGLSVEDADACSRLYTGGADRADPLVSPLLAPDVTGLPPTLIVTAGYDCLHDEGVAYAQRLTDAGVPCELLDYPDYLHGFLSVPRLFNGVDDAWNAIAAFIEGVPAGAQPAQRGST